MSEDEYYGKRAAAERKAAAKDIKDINRLAALSLILTGLQVYLKTVVEDVKEEVTSLFHPQQ